MSIKNIKVHGFHKIDDAEIDKLKSVYDHSLCRLAFDEAFRIETTCDLPEGGLGELCLLSQLDPFSQHITINDRNLEFRCIHIVELHHILEYQYACKGQNLEVEEEEIRSYMPEKQSISISVVRIGNHRYAYYEIM